MDKIVEYIGEIEKVAETSNIEDVWGMVGKLNKLIDYRTKSSTLINNLILASLNREVVLPEIIDMLGVVKKEFANDDVDLNTANYEVPSDMLDDNPNMLSGLASKEGNVEHFRNILNDVNTRFINYGDKDVIGMVHLPTKTIHPFSLSKQMLLNNIDFADVADFEILDPDVARKAITESMVSGDVAAVSGTLKLTENTMDKFLDIYGFSNEYYGGELDVAWGEYKEKFAGNDAEEYMGAVLDALGAMMTFWASLAGDNAETMGDAVEELDLADVKKDWEVYNKIVTSNENPAKIIRAKLQDVSGRWVKLNNPKQLIDFAVKGDYDKIKPIVDKLFK